MSSPIQQAEDLDPALRYAPRWARDRLPPLAGRPLATPVPLPMRRAKPEFSGDRSMLELQRQLLLDPDAIPEPPVDDVRTLAPIAARLSAVVGLAAVIAWGVVSLPGLKKSGEIIPSDVKTPAMAVRPVKLVQTQEADAAPQVNESFVAMNEPVSPVPPANPPITSVVTTTIAAPTQPAPTSTPPTPAPGQGMTTPTPAAAPSKQASLAPVQANPAATSTRSATTTLHLDNDEVAGLVQRGKTMLASGDIVSARLLLRRAADAGSSEAAFALGSTFDPLFIEKLGAVGMAPDPAQARQWYKRAADLGSSAAMGQLAKLEQSQ